MVQQRKTQKLRPIDKPPAPTEPTVMEPLPGLPAFTEGAGGDWDFLCPHCGFALGLGLHPDTIRNIVVKCSECGKWSEFPA